ncbi:hypothetical protein M5K25_018973 [Dendrobium thyrsiflorum]|uniref:Uncharacterized protein n=1 Tax=Dendrobium thyrsiflorum TaxID=117978 RepID=A0ABD0UDN1_DENTH
MDSCSRYLDILSRVHQSSHEGNIRRYIAARRGMDVLQSHHVEELVFCTVIHCYFGEGEDAAP